MVLYSSGKMFDGSVSHSVFLVRVSYGDVLWWVWHIDPSWNNNSTAIECVCVCGAWLEAKFYFQKENQIINDDPRRTENKREKHTGW